MIEALLNYGFIQRAFMAGILLGVIAPVIGVFLVLKRLSLIADALSHVTLTGIAAGMLWNKLNPMLLINPVISGMGMSVVGAMLIEQFRKVYRYYQELAIPIILATGLGLGVILISLADGFNSELFGYLFGSVNAVNKTDVWLILAVTMIVITLVYFVFNELLYLTFDEEGARLAGIPSRRINILFIILVALVIAVGMRVVGILLISSMITLPVAASLKIARSFRQTIVYAIVFAQIAIITGIVLAYYLSWPTGGTIVLVAVVILLLTLACKRYFKSI
ncbi:metal ABC transporter permease [Desulfuribacillus alkaliarsenatis]|uniref:Metal ABC transporter permease n=1 Tax=Desulfuribacillus alkaliarsenatis TaxID=766136 RepID=A0A1E5G1E8_9FIRM|nr:metal ABC transporter permease [Desulfuribacillus alkaliarsenatis]OEF96734.1 metal ABC transporter permease [Desulfuribacillus alkaliarsenatis]